MNTNSNTISARYLWRHKYLALMVLLLAGCKSPFERTRDASTGGPTGTFSGTANYVIFNNELASGGGAFLYPGPEGQTLSFNDQSNPISRRSIRYSWTGELVTNAGCPAQNPSNFAGFDLMHTATRADYASQGRNLTQAGYTKVTFYAHGSLSTDTYLKVEVASPGSPSDACLAVVSPCIKFLGALGDPAPSADVTCTPRTLTDQWAQYTVTIPTPSTDLANVRDFFKATLIFTPSVGAPNGQGGTVYFDKIQYEP